MSWAHLSGPQDVTDDIPALVGERLEQGQHRIADVVEVEVARICPLINVERERGKNMQIRYVKVLLTKPGAPTSSDEAPRHSTVIKKCIHLFFRLICFHLPVDFHPGDEQFLLE